VGRQEHLAASSFCFISMKAAHTDCISDKLNLLFGFRLGPRSVSRGNKNGNLLHFATVTLLVDGAGITQSVLRLATGWTSNGSKFESW
jgi:hypothetical protein